MGRFPSWKCPGRQPIKRRGIKRFLRMFWGLEILQEPAGHNTIELLRSKCLSCVPQGVAHATPPPRKGLQSLSSMQSFSGTPCVETSYHNTLGQARKRHININVLVRLVLGRPRVCPWDKPRVSYCGSPAFPWDEPSLSLGQTRRRRAAERVCMLKVFVPVSLAIIRQWQSISDCVTKCSTAQTTFRIHCLFKKHLWNASCSRRCRPADEM